MSVGQCHYYIIVAAAAAGEFVYRMEAADAGCCLRTVQCPPSNYTAASVSDPELTSTVVNDH